MIAWGWSLTSRAHSNCARHATQFVVIEMQIHFFHEFPFRFLAFFRFLFTSLLQFLFHFSFFSEAVLALLVRPFVFAHFFSCCFNEFFISEIKVKASQFFLYLERAFFALPYPLRPAAFSFPLIPAPFGSLTSCLCNFVGLVAVRYFFSFFS